MSVDSRSTSAVDGEEQRSSALVLTISAAVGVTAMAYGVWSAFDVRHDTHPFELTRWVIGLDVIHDILLVPIVGIVGWVLVRLTPRSVRRFVRWAALTTAVLCLIAWPFVRGYGKNPRVPSLLLRDYGAGLALYIVLVWAMAALAAVVSHVRSRRPTS